MKILVAMSGGVDSSVTAALLSNAGNECIGCTMRLYSNEDINLTNQKTCCSLSDTEDARNIAMSLKMKYYVFNFTDEFKEKVINKFVNSYYNGITPNPCIDCNQFFKFGKLFERADILNCDYIATGHYAQIQNNNGIFTLKKAVDLTKDQSYVLYGMTQKQLSKTILPLGSITKNTVRKIAHDNNLCNASKPDSQDICFVPQGSYPEFIESYTKQECPKGNFIDLDGNVIGTHKGIIHYTVGQRKHLGISSSNPYYVHSIIPQTNTVVLSQEKDLYRSDIIVADFNWIAGKAPNNIFHCNVKIRYKGSEIPSTVNVVNDNAVHIIFDHPSKSVTPGQAAVLYDKDIVLGGGVIVNDFE